MNDLKVNDIIMLVTPPGYMRGHKGCYPGSLFKIINLDNLNSIIIAEALGNSMARFYPNISEINKHFQLYTHPISSSPSYNITPPSNFTIGNADSYKRAGESVEIDFNPNKLYIVHKVCRACGQAGSHNVVNHKEYYWCSSCKDEC